MPLGLSSPGLDSPDGPIEKRGVRWRCSRLNSSKTEDGRVEVCSDEMYRDPGAVGEEDCDRALPCVSWGGEVCGVIALGSSLSLRAIVSVLLSLVYDP